MGRQRNKPPQRAKTAGRGRRQGTRERGNEGAREQGTKGRETKGMSARGEGSEAEPRVFIRETLVRGDSVERRRGGEKSKGWAGAGTRIS
jgi:hypothetical protein